MANTAALTTAFSCLLFSDAFLLSKPHPPVTTNTPASGTMSNLSYAFLEDILIKERQILQDYIIILENTLNAKDQTLEQKLNKTLDEISNITQKMTDEKNERVRLQKDYDKLVVDFYDLNVEHVAMKTENKDLKANITKQDTEIKFLEEAVDNLTDSINKINVTTLLSDHAEILALKHKTGQQIGFSADYPKAGHSTGTITFNNVVSNIGNQYNSTSGEFTCEVPGLYFFTLVVYNTGYAGVASCFIRKNSINKMEAYLSHPHPNGYSEASTSVVLHLNQGDKVDLAGCTVSENLEWLTSLSGFLINAD